MTYRPLILVLVSLFLCVTFVLGTEVVAVMGVPEVVDPKHKPGWRLTFEDDFEGDRIDLTKWSYLPNWKRHDGYWSPEEAFLDGEGHLIIQVNEREGTYYSGAVATRDRFEQAYGYYEIRCQLPKEEGFWTAFWLMTDGVQQLGNEGRDGTEIDIFESPFSKEDRIQHALHWDGYGPEHRSAGYAPYIKGIYEGFHTFALEWNVDEYIFYVDGKETWRTSAGGVSQVPSYLKITAEVGPWGGDIRRATLPAQLVVDYVRVYERVHEVKIDSPVAGTTVLADEPILVSVNPAIDIAQVQIIQNDVELYQGSSIPKQLRLSAPVGDDDEEHLLTVVVTDVKGRVFEQIAKFKVRRTLLELPQDQASYIQGTVEVNGRVGFGSNEQADIFALTLQPIRVFEETEPNMVYEGGHWPGSLSLNTLEFEDGAYDLILMAKMGQGTSSKDVRRIVIRNWERLLEDFDPPGTWFGGAFDRLKTIERSQGWEFLNDEAVDLFGDNTRIASKGLESEYLIWKQPRLRRYELIVYARDDMLSETIELAVSPDLQQWQLLDPKLVVLDYSDQGWLKLCLAGDVITASENDYFRVVLPSGLGRNEVQLGSLELCGVARLPGAE
ncbi:MAG: glycoside hydrolase family 16 protein [Limnochordia bacterium]|nr:glycoside hydrolase family 16 protein [Limnochordia bacterium]